MLKKNSWKLEQWKKSSCWLKKEKEKKRNIKSRKIDKKKKKNVSVQAHHNIAKISLALHLVSIFLLTSLLYSSSSNTDHILLHITLFSL